VRGSWDFDRNWWGEGEQVPMSGDPANEVLVFNVEGMKRLLRRN